MDELIKNAPLIIIVLVFFWQNKIFVTPTQLEKKHREILKECHDEFVSIEVFREFQAETRNNFKEVKHGIESVNANINEIKTYLLNNEVGNDKN